MRKTFFHEDDYCQIEVLPLVNLEFCLHQAGTIHKFSEQHRAAMGWDSMYVRREPPATLESLRIAASDIRASMSGVLAEYDEIETGTFSNVAKCQNTLAFGNDDTATIFVGFSADRIANAIWCSNALFELTRLPSADRLLLADWAWAFICPLSDTTRLQSYLAADA